MTVILQITDGTTTVNLQNNTGPELQDNYLPSFAVPTGDGTIPPDVTEAIPALVRITSDDNLASTLQDIWRLSEQARLYSANRHQTPVWLKRKLDGESGGAAEGVQYLVKSLSFTPNAQFGGLFDVGPAITNGRIGVIPVTHHPYGEAVSAATTTGTDNVSVIGGASDYTDVTGDVPARMNYVHIDDLAAARVYRQFWLGFRSDSRAGGDAANVASLWELEDGTPNAAADSAVATDATASPGGGGNTKVRCTFATDETWASRVSILMSDVTASYGNQIGSYVVLLRAMVDSGVAQVKLRSGSGAGAVLYRQGPVVDIADTAWNLYNLGTVEWPTRSLHAAPTTLFAATYDQRDGMAIWARVKPGETTPTQFDMDCLILVPADEYWIHVQSADVSATADELYTMAAPEDVAESVTIDGSSNWIQTTNPISVIGEGIPTGDGRLFIAVANDNDGTAPAFGDDVDVEVSYYPRWIGPRGAE